MTARSRRFRSGLSLLVAIAAAIVGANANAVAPTFRVELYALPTLTLTREQALAGTQDGAPPATIAAELRLPFVAAARMPAVVLLHGDAGAVSNQVAWSDEVNALGIAVLTVDSFSGRGAVASGASFATMPDSIGSAARVVDAERALAFLARHPRIDPERIAVMGFSSGGGTVLLAAQNRFASAFGVAGVGFAAYIALYPDGNVRLRNDTKSEPGPLRIFIGEADVLTSADACVRLVARLRGAGQDPAVMTFAGAHHAFDAVANPNLTRIPGVLSAARCDLEERADGKIVNIDTGRELDDQDRCITKGLIAGYDAAADSAAKAAVKALLTERFRLAR